MKAKGPRIILFHCTFLKKSVPPGLSDLVLEYNVWGGGALLQLNGNVTYGYKQHEQPCI